jgi:hypothetical protein
VTFAHDAGLFPFQVEVASDRVLLVSLTEQDYRQASFLDQRLLDRKRPMQWAAWRDLEAQSAHLPADAAWIFHIGHVGSTLVSRLLGEADGPLALREPQLLRQLTELNGLRGEPHSPWPPELFPERLRTAARWLSRGFRPGQRALVKATSFASALAPELLAGGNPALFLYMGPERYIQTILAGENSRRELGILAGPRLARLHAAIGAAPYRLWQLDEAKQAALSWACEMATLAAAPQDSVSWLDFDRFMALPADSLRGAAKHLSIELGASDAAALVASPIMTQYSKAPEHGYSSELRESVLAEAARQRGPEIADALRWLERAGTEYAPVGLALERARKG